MNVLDQVDPNLLGLGFVLVFFLLMVIFALAGHRAARQSRPAAGLRSIRAFERLNHAVGLAVEAGHGLHVSLGRGNLTGVQGASALLGLSVLNRIARSASMGDRPPVATSGEGTISILSQETLRGAYRTIGATGFEPASGQLTGVTPFSYAAGTLPLMHDGGVSASFLAGHFGPEAALIAEAGERTGGLVLAGSDHLPGQAVLFATAQEPLIGEELYASGAYLLVGPLHLASVRTQDVLRWILIVAILGGALIKVIGGW